MLNPSFLAAKPAPAFTAPAIAEGAEAFELSGDAKYHVALHFSGDAAAETVLADLKAWDQAAPTVAGVHHVAIVKGSPEELRPAFAGASLTSVDLHADPGGAIHESYGIGPEHTLVVVSPKGEEVWRRAAAEAGEHPDFKTFADWFARATKASALSHYNLPEAGAPAIQGYDPVSYFNGAPKKGSARLTSDYRGVTYRFASRENRLLFAENPEKYAPTYGGWCATAMAKGDKVEIDPENYKVTGGRLFLFYKGFWGDAKKEWVKDEASLAREADQEWRKIAGE